MKNSYVVYTNLQLSVQVIQLKSSSMSYYYNLEFLKSYTPGIFFLQKPQNPTIDDFL